MYMGKLHKIRKSIEADPGVWVWRHSGVVTNHRALRWQGNMPVPSNCVLHRWHSYAKFIEHVLNGLGYGRGSGQSEPVHARIAKTAKRVVVQPDQKYEELGVGVGKSDSAERLLGVCHSSGATAGQVTTGIMQVQLLPPTTEKQAGLAG